MEGRARQLDDKIAGRRGGSKRIREAPVGRPKFRGKPVDVTTPNDEVQRQSCEEANGGALAFAGVSADYPPCDTTVVRRIESIEERTNQRGERPSLLTLR